MAILGTCSFCGKSNRVTAHSHRVTLPDGGHAWIKIGTCCTKDWYAWHEMAIKAGERCFCRQCGQEREPFDWSVGYRRAGAGLCWSCFQEGVNRVVNVFQTAGPVSWLVLAAEPGRIFSPLADKLLDGKTEAQQHYRSAMKNLTKPEGIFVFEVGGQK